MSQIATIAHASKVPIGLLGRIRTVRLRSAEPQLGLPLQAGVISDIHKPDSSQSGQVLLLLASSPLCATEYHYVNVIDDRTGPKVLLRHESRKHSDTVAAFSSS